MIEIKITTSTAAEALEDLVTLMAQMTAHAAPEKPVKADKKQAPAEWSPCFFMLSLPSIS